MDDVLATGGTLAAVIAVDLTLSLIECPEHEEISYIATKAASLLKNTDKTVDEIARLTGYQSPAAFRTMFKKWSQTTPRKFRSYFSGTD